MPLTSADSAIRNPSCPLSPPPGTAPHSRGLCDHPRTVVCFIPCSEHHDLDVLAGENGACGDEGVAADDEVLGEGVDVAEATLGREHRLFGTRNLTPRPGRIRAMP